jgi:hypothetical protein
MKVEEVKERLEQVEREMEVLSAEKELLVKELYKLDDEKRGARGTEIKQRLDEIFKLASKSKMKFYKNIDEFNEAKENSYSLEAERQKLLEELRELERVSK